MKSHRKATVAQLVRITARGLFVLTVTALGGLSAHADTALVAAASSLRQVWPALLENFTGDVDTSFGASGTLAQQIVHGAPFELFLSADMATIDWLLASHPTLATPDTVYDAMSVQSHVYAEGLLVLAVRRNLLPDDGSDTDFETDDVEYAALLLRSGKLSRLALANARHAPYGQAAERWLSDNNIPVGESAALLKIVGENAAQAVQFVLSGAADAALIPASLVQSDTVRSRIQVFTLANAERWAVWHAMLLLPSAGDTARAFHSYLLSDQAQSIFTAAGFRAR